MSRNVIAHFFLFVVNFIYGANYYIAKTVMPAYIGPSGFILLRVISATLMFFLTALFFAREKIERSDRLRFMLCGLFGIAINQLTFFMGLSLSSPINASIIMTATPVLVLITAAVLLREKVTARKVAGILAGASGALILLTFGKKISFSDDTFAGDLLVFANAISYGVFLVLVKPLMLRYHFLTVMKWVFLCGMFFVFPFGFGELGDVSWKSIPEPGMWAIAYVVIATTFLAYMLNSIGLQTLSPSVVSIYIYLQPLIATVFSLAAGKDQLTLIKIVSALLIFAGVYLVSFRRTTVAEKTKSHQE
jgi:drug/metabolite transporter (DMT)-like permease